MKKILIFIITVIMLSFSNSVAAKNNGFYIGGGDSYAVGSFDIDDGSLRGYDFNYDDYDLNVSSGNSNGFNLKIGYRFNDVFSLGLKFNDLSPFKGKSDEFTDSYDYSSSYSYSSSYFNYYYSYQYHGDWAFNLESEADIETLILAVKISLPILRTVKPFVTAGFGIMSVDYTELLIYSSSWSSYSSYSGSNSGSYYYEYPDSETLSGPCIKIGAGLDFFITNNFAFEFEAAYVQGMDEVDRFEYMNYTGGITIYF